MKVMRLILCIALMLSLCSCRAFIDIIWDRYECPVDEVERVQIVKLDKYVTGEYRYEYIVLSEISDYYDFIERLNNIKCGVNLGEPIVLHEGYIVIKIDYINGDFDLLYDGAQWFNRDGINNTGFYVFDEEQFETLIEDYLR